MILFATEHIDWNLDILCVQTQEETHLSVSNHYSRSLWVLTMAEDTDLPQGILLIFLHKHTHSYRL